jgi:hypothetical protein
MLSVVGSSDEADSNPARIRRQIASVRVSIWLAWRYWSIEANRSAGNKT